MNAVELRPLPSQEPQVARPSLATANAARKEASRLRAEWLLSLTDGFVTTSDLITAACQPSGKPLLRLTLRQVLAHQPGWGDVRVRQALRQIRRVLDLPPTDERKFTVMWLLDSRASGRRFHAWVDATQPKNTTPWPGFPFAHDPKTATTQLNGASSAPYQEGVAL